MGFILNIIIIFFIVRWLSPQTWRQMMRIVDNVLQILAAYSSRAREKRERLHQDESNAEKH